MKGKSVGRGRQIGKEFAACLALAAICAFSGHTCLAQSPDPPAKSDTVQQKKDQLTADTAKLLKLAAELKVAVDKTTKDQLSITVIKKAGEVEKLAHKVRDEMKLLPAS